MRLSHLVGAAAAILLASFATANAQQTQAGVLRCHGGPTVGAVLGSATQLNCTYYGIGGHTDDYVASIHRFGVDLGATKQTVVGWRVIAPTRQVGPGALAGNYGGVGGNVSFIVGGGSNVLVGGSQNSFALQPVSLQGQTGLNVSGGIVGLTLSPVVYEPRPHHRRHHRHH